MFEKMYLHNDLRLGDVGRDALVREDRTTVHVDFIVDGNVVTEDGAAFQARL